MDNAVELLGFNIGQLGQASPIIAGQILLAHPFLSPLDTQHKSLLDLLKTFPDPLHTSPIDLRVLPIFLLILLVRDHLMLVMAGHAALAEDAGMLALLCQADQGDLGVFVLGAWVFGLHFFYGIFIIILFVISLMRL